MLRFKGYYSLLIGICMVGLWCMLLATRQVPELLTEPYRIIAHLSSEFITAALLIWGRISVLKFKKNTQILNI